MTATTYTEARQYACPAGHVTGVITPERGGLACPACRQPMAPKGAPLKGSWELEECCTPGGPNGTWYGPRKDARKCRSCCGTQLRATCTVCLAGGCDGLHPECLNCDGGGRVDCLGCDGEGRHYDEHDEVSGPCAAPGCEEGRVACPECQGSGKPAKAA